MVRYFLPVPLQLFNLLSDVFCRADLAGFTKLCSEFKDPQFAKQLIATLYGHFDENADRLGLWKMDTIGDA